MIPVVFRKAAHLDFVAAVRWYERRREGLGAEFSGEIGRALLAGREFPDRAPVIEAGIRRIKARRFPFNIFYRIRGGQLVVLAIFHARRNPAGWRKRV